MIPDTVTGEISNTVQKDDITYDYVRDRLKEQITYYSKNSMKNKNYHHLSSVMEILCAALIPFLVGYAENLNITLTIGLLGVLVAVLGSIKEIYNWQFLWHEYRTTTETLKHELHLFMTKSGPYNTEKAKNILAVRCEQIISKQNSQHFIVNTTNEKQET